MANVTNKKTDRASYDKVYAGSTSNLSRVENISEYIDAYQSSNIGPYYKTGNTKGFVRGESIKYLIASAESRDIPRNDICVLDAGSGRGELSVYLACLGFNVTGVDISSEAKACGENLASSVGVENNCKFLAESLENITIEDSSIDYVIGHASLHHFIKYSGVPHEFKRVLKREGKGYFADAFGENKLYHIFHDKEKMERLGDVTLTKNLLEDYFSDFKLNITPTDWFTMLDKLYLKVLPKTYSSIVKNISALHYWLDRKIPAKTRMSLFFSGAVLTEITKR